MWCIVSSLGIRFLFALVLLGFFVGLGFFCGTGGHL